MGVVQGTSHPEHVVMDAESVSGRLLPPGSVYAFLAEHRRELFSDELFADLFPSPLGRPSVPADVVAAVLVLQALEGRSDREAVEALTFDLRWKAACGLAITDTAFDPSTLTYWRRRLAASARPETRNVRHRSTRACAPPRRASNSLGNTYPLTQTSLSCSYRRVSPFRIHRSA